ncbi:MAG: hypothetical protein V4707_06040 [Pseudomonadota bacterium]
MKNEAPEDEATPNNVTQEELQEAFSIPAVMVNKTLITSGGFHARLTFLEVREADDVIYRHARAAVTMDLAQLLKLRDLINRLEGNMQSVEIASEDGADG